MDDKINWLITILYGDTLIKCAFQCGPESLSGDCSTYPMEPENRAEIHALLPEHVRSCGPIVDIQQIFEVSIFE